MPYQLQALTLTLNPNLKLGNCCVPVWLLPETAHALLLLLVQSCMGVICLRQHRLTWCWRQQQT
jgi:hypothetical protein